MEVVYEVSDLMSIFFVPGPLGPGIGDEGAVGNGIRRRRRGLSGRNCAMAAGIMAGMGDGLAVIGVVVIDDAVGIGGFVASNVMHRAVRSRSVIVVGIVSARGRRDGIGTAVDVAAVRRIDGCVGSIGDGVKAAKGLDEGQAEEDDEQRRDAHDGKSPFEGVMMMVKPNQDEVETDGSDEAREQGWNHFDGRTAKNCKVETYAVHIESGQNGPPIGRNIFQTQEEDDRHDDKGDGRQKGKEADEEHRNGCRDDDVHDAPPGKGDE